MDSPHPMYRDRGRLRDTCDHSLRAIRASAALLFCGLVPLLSGLTHAQPSEMEPPHRVPVTSSSGSPDSSVTVQKPIAASASRSAMASVEFRSVFDRYQSFRDEKIGSWRDANDTVTRVGGWREYLKEAQRPDTSAPPVSATESSQPGPTRSSPEPTRPVSPPAAKTDPHAGHGAKK
jgi:hypothetical protein